MAGVVLHTVPLNVSKATITAILLVAWVTREKQYCSDRYSLYSSGYATFPTGNDATPKDFGLRVLESRVCGLKKMFKK